VLKEIVPVGGGGFFVAALARISAFSFPRMSQWLGIYCSCSSLFCYWDVECEFLNSSAVGWRFSALVMNWMAEIRCHFGRKIWLVELCNSPRGVRYGSDLGVKVTGVSAHWSSFFEENAVDTIAGSFCVSIVGAVRVDLHPITLREVLLEMSL
jgi:hypothetical protein